MSAARERVQEDAEDFATRHYLDLHGHRAGAERGFIAGRTVTAEQIEQAAGEIDAATGGADEGWPERVARAAFTAAGFIVAATKPNERPD